MPDTPPYRDPSQPVEARAQDLLSHMTLEEKVRQMSQRDAADFLQGDDVDPATLHERLAMGIGTLQDPRRDPRTNAKTVNALQRYLVEETRLGIPALVIAECLHGHMSDGTTVFPQAIGLASTWNPRLIGVMAAAIAKEARAVGVAQALAPDLDLARDPRWGRVEETYGEDPYLASMLGVAYVKGMQGDGPGIDREHLVCTIKHYAAHGSPEAGVNLAPVAGSLRDLFTTYLPPFRAAIEAGALSVMPAYSEYMDVPASQSSLLLTRVLREAWGFKGYTYSDYGAIDMLHNMHRTAATPAEAGRLALEAGMDLEAPSDFGFGQNLIDMVRDGVVSEALVDRAVLRILSVKFAAGLFENPYADEEAMQVINRPAHRELAREIAHESIVLLKNESNLLPLSPQIRSLAVIGPNAAVAQLGDYTRPLERAVSPLQGIKEGVSRETEVRYARGCDLYGTSTDGFAEAVEAARAADAAIVCIGETSHALGGTGWGIDTGSATCGEGYDRTELSPSGMQEALVRAVVETGKPVIVVLLNGRPISSEWIAEHVPAILEAWYPGEEGGHALADILFGSVNPSGKLTITVPRSAGHIPAFYNHKPSAGGYYHRPGSPEQPGRDYVFSSPTPLFPFGHGLSYTTFAYSDLGISPERISPYGSVTVKVTVTNTGDRAGQEVVQLYLRDLYSSVTTPVKSLRRFEKIALAPGESKAVTFTLGRDDLELFNDEMSWVVEPGEFEVMVGDLTGIFTVEG
ncbi:MAG: glycoside hydrolase family 3 N-terminal domain-containing protein [Armatimonadota bacterium]